MNTTDLLAESELPEGFTYPRQFMRIVSLGLTEIQPWYILEGDLLRKTSVGLAQRYPDRQLIPFARRQDNDDIACWQSISPNEVFIIHDFASPGWEQRDKFSTFYDWLRHAVEDLIDFDR